MFDLVLAAIAAGDEVGEQLVDVETITRSDLDGTAWIRCQSLDQCSHRGDHHRGWVVAGETPAHGEALTHGRDLWADSLEREGVPGREQEGRSVE